MQIPLNLNIRIIGDPLLSQKANSVEKIDKDIKNFGDELIKMMLKYDGVGLAATQVGVALRVIALAIPKPDKKKPPESISPGEQILPSKMPAIIINPRIVSFGKEREIREEGCLSVPGIFAEVERPSSIIFEGIINYNEKITIECGGLLSRAIQHEIDHLDGILFINRLNKRSFSKIKASIDKLKKEASQNNFIREKR